MGWDSIDFFAVSITLTQIAKTLGKQNSDISWGTSSPLLSC